ncbi:MAG: ParB/RepB/Spo0J family partition protein [Bacteroidota bacterium]|nr:ParB/RepB/Spo0J family partition protein [Bacteroidota bacterium]
MNKKKSVLGRGLSAILKNSKTDITVTNEDSKIVGETHNISIKNITPNPFQPRSNFEINSLNNLAESIKELGVIQPITVRKLGYNKYQIISGERRFRACEIIQKNSIPCFVRIANDQEMLEMALVENIQRENLDPIEIALSFQRLISECDLTQEACSKRVGKERSTVTNFLRLLKLPEEIQSGLKAKLINVGHARALVGINNKNTQLNIYQDIIENGFSVREVEEIVRTFGSSEYKKVIRTIKNKPNISFSEQRYLHQISTILDISASIKKNKNGSSKLTLNFKSEEKLFNILEKIIN